jgi:hypothetical protein
MILVYESILFRAMFTEWSSSNVMTSLQYQSCQLNTKHFTLLSTAAQRFWIFSLPSFHVSPRLIRFHLI